MIVFAFTAAAMAWAVAICVWHSSWWFWLIERPAGIDGGADGMFGPAVGSLHFISAPRMAFSIPRVSASVSALPDLLSCSPCVWA